MNNFNFHIWDLSITLDELFYSLVGEVKNNRKENIDSIIDDYEKYRALQRIYIRIDERNYDSLDWDRGHKDGLFCLADYFRFPELEKYKEEAIKNYLKQIAIKCLSDIRSRYYQEMECSRINKKIKLKNKWFLSLAARTAVEIKKLSEEIKKTC